MARHRNSKTKEEKKKNKTMDARRPWSVLPGPFNPALLAGRRPWPLHPWRLALTMTAIHGGDGWAGWRSRWLGLPVVMNGTEYAQ